MDTRSETTRRGSNKRAHEDGEPEPPAKRPNVAQDNNTQSYATSTDVNFWSHTGSSERISSSFSSSSVVFSLPSSSSSSSIVLDISDLLQTVQDSNHPSESFERCVSANSIQEIETESINEQSRRTNSSSNPKEEQDFSPIHELQCHFDQLPPCPHVSGDRLPGIQHLNSLALQSQNSSVQDYMDRQPDLNEQMRGILFDWLVEVAEEYKLKSSTLYLTISIIDRYLSGNVLNRDKLQLVGVSSMLIASKSEEPRPPRVSDFVFISDNSYTKAEIFKMEKKILASLGHLVRIPTTHTYLEQFQRDVHHLDEEVCQLSNYLGELALMSYSFLRYEPRRIAASVIAIALHTTQCPPWSSALQTATNFTLPQLRDCMADVLALYTNAPVAQLQAVREKYSAPNPYLCVSSISPPESLPNM